MKRVTELLAAVVLLCAVSAVGYMCGTTVKIVEFVEYYNSVETLLDSVDAEFEDFTDVMVETDVYQNYLEARNAIQ